MAGRLLVGVLLAAGTVVQTGLAAQDSPSPQVHRVLYIGNSLTDANDLPALVTGLARARGTHLLEHEEVTFANYSLEDHWNRGDARRAIAAGRWTTVVLQQGPSALPESQLLLVEYVRRFDEQIRRAGARTALYMVWPARDGDFPGVSRSYTVAARSVQGLLLPVGDAWREAWRLDPALPLYGPDGFHPTPLGSYLAALVIYARLSGESPVGLPAPAVSSRPGEAALPLDAAVVDLLQRAAAVLSK